MEVILKDTSDHPLCPHGPCLVFERHSQKGAKDGKQFYACSACRDRSICSFFHWVGDKMSDKVKKHWKKLIKESKLPFSHDKCMQRLVLIQKQDSSGRIYCKTCSLLLSPKENNHQEHDLVHHVTSEQLLKPTTLFQSLENNKAEAQYFFSEKTIKFMTKLLKNLAFSKFLSIGVPKIHEHLVSEDPEMKTHSSLLLDIDHRYMQFFGPNQFCHYNIFNNYFFAGESSEEKLKEYLLEKDDKKVIILLDPPFGGLVDAISYSLQILNKWWQTANNKSSTENIPIVWCFPYFLEPKISKSMPHLKMMDYKVEYLNHKKFGMKLTSKGSPVRIFTNIKNSSFALPSEDGYRFCKKCQKYVWRENKHCSQCNACATKHGSTYRHCDLCKTCVKSSYIHCSIHDRCGLQSKSVQSECKCGLSESGENSPTMCYKCRGYGHKKRDCPTEGKREKQPKKKRKSA